MRVQPAASIPQQQHIMATRSAIATWQLASQHLGSSLVLFSVLLLVLKRVRTHKLRQSVQEGGWGRLFKL
jgi:hypothetical protein